MRFSMLPVPCLLILWLKCKFLFVCSRLEYILLNKYKLRFFNEVAFEISFAKTEITSLHNVKFTCRRIAMRLGGVRVQKRLQMKALIKYISKMSFTFV